jgi:hypothetical protein
LKRKEVYSIIAVIITGLSLAMIFYISMLPNDNDSISIAKIQDYSDEDNSRYMGYIFNDYNKKVNLNFVDKSSGRVSDNGIVNTISLSALGIDNNADSMRKVRSERIMENIALKEESLNRELRQNN